MSEPTTDREVLKSVLAAEQLVVDMYGEPNMPAHEMVAVIEGRRKAFAAAKQHLASPESDGAAELLREYRGWIKENLSLITDNVCVRRRTATFEGNTFQTGEDPKVYYERLAWFQPFMELTQRVDDFLAATTTPTPSPPTPPEEIELCKQLYGNAFVYDGQLLDPAKVQIHTATPPTEGEAEGPNFPISVYDKVVKLEGPYWFGRRRNERSWSVKGPNDLGGYNNLSHENASTLARRLNAAYAAGASTRGSGEAADARLFAAVEKICSVLGATDDKGPLLAEAHRELCDAAQKQGE